MSYRSIHVVFNDLLNSTVKNIFVGCKSGNVFSNARTEIMSKSVTQSHGCYIHFQKNIFCDLKHNWKCFVNNKPSNMLNRTKEHANNIISGFGERSLRCMKAFPPSAVPRMTSCSGFSVKFGEKLNELVLLLLRQCNAIAAHRLRRATQMMNFYSNLGYDGQTFRRIINTMGSNILQRLRNVKNDRPLFMLFSSAAVFNWEENRIQQSELQETADEIGLIHRNKSVSSSRMCVESDSNAMIGWEQVIDQENLAAYRKPIPDSSYLYEYKVFGTFNDIPARAFYNAQMNFDFRKKWDRLVVKLDVIETDENSGSDVIHWITHFPYPMYQREYVYMRRILVDPQQKVMVIISRNTDHPEYPAEGKYVRVSNYMSKMVIKPHNTSFDENGFDYILTYRDDPQANFPTFAYNWMATTGVPDFVKKMHDAAKNLHEKSSPQTRPVEGADYNKHPGRSRI